MVKRGKIQELLSEYGVTPFLKSQFLHTAEIFAGAHVCVPLIINDKNLCKLKYNMEVICSYSLNCSCLLRIEIYNRSYFYRCPEWTNRFNYYSIMPSHS